MVGCSLDAKKLLKNLATSFVSLFPLNKFKWQWLSMIRSTFNAGCCWPCLVHSSWLNWFIENERCLVSVVFDRLTWVVKSYLLDILHGSSAVFWKIMPFSLRNLRLPVLPFKADGWYEYETSFRDFGKIIKMLLLAVFFSVQYLDCHGSLATRMCWLLRTCGWRLSKL
jgi:hypothetical protein